MRSPTLYQRVLGAEFERLPPVLQRFHGQARGARAVGNITVERGAGPWREAAAGALRLPRGGHNIALRLQVIPWEGREVWVRQFEGQRLETHQWQEGPYLVERAGPLCLVFRVEADEAGLTFRLQRSRMRGWPLPSRLAMRVGATASGTENGWRIRVAVDAPLLGQLVMYSGDIFPESC